MTASAHSRTRHLTLEGVVNFRDLGGYSGRDGKWVRWGRVFRSDAPIGLTDHDRGAIEELGIRTVLDMRDVTERSKHPTDRLAGAKVHEIGFLPYNADALVAAAADGLDDSAIEVLVQEIYRRFVLDQRHTYSNLLSLLASEPMPVLIHCTSGRDRTGFAAAVLLLALGVSREQVLEDYVLSDQYQRNLTFQYGSRLSEEAMAKISRAHPSYLKAAFTVIDEQWSSDVDFVRRGLGVPVACLRKLYERLLESPPKEAGQ